MGETKSERDVYRIEICDVRHETVIDIKSSEEIVREYNMRAVWRGECRRESLVRCHK